VPFEDLAHLLEVEVQDLAEGLRVQPLTEARRALQVAEDDRDRPPDLRRDGLGHETRAAEAAETEPVGVLLAAVGADLHGMSL
jgi:hypothetical protein